MSTPQLRFKGFEGKWQEVKGNNLFDSISDKKHNSDLPILAITQDQGAIPRELINYKVIVSDASVDSYKVVNVGDFIISLRSFQGGIEYSNYNGICSPAYIILRNTKEIHGPFYKIYFKTYNYISKLGEKLEGIRDGKMVSYKYFSEISIPYPSIQEQEKIASFFTIIDEKLKLLKEKKEKLELYKKGVMQQIFSQKLRFKDEKGNEFPEWVEKRLGKIVSITTGKLDANAMVDNGNYRFYTCAKDYYFIDKFAFDTEALLISGNGANVGYIHHYSGKFNAYQRTYVLSGFKDVIVIYLKYFLQKNLGARILKEKKAGNTPYIVLDTLSEMNVEIPPIVEQQKIADFLSALDTKINLVSTQIEKTELWKKGLLQQMFV